MPSLIDATKPADGTPAVKNDLRQNLTRAQTEVNHGGFIGTSGWPTGTVERQTIAELRDRMVSIKKFASGTIGAGQDATTAFQTAVNTGELIWVPPGDYLLTAPVVHPGTLILFGANGKNTAGALNSRIYANGGFGQVPMFHRGIYVDASNTLHNSIGSLENLGETVLLQDIVLQNFDERGCCIQVYHVAGPVGLNRCTIASQFRGALFSSCFNAEIRSTAFESNYYGTTIGATNNWTDAALAWGLNVTSHCTVQENQFVGWGTAIYTTGQQVTILSNRLEVNGHAIRLGGIQYGFELLGQDWPSSALVENISMESNLRGFYICNGSFPILRFCRAASFQFAGPGGRTPEYGLMIEEGCQGTILENVSMSLWASRAAMILKTPCIMRQSGGSNDAPGRPGIEGSGAMLTWYGDASTYTPGNQLINAPLNSYRNFPLTMHERTVTTFPNLQLRGIKGLDGLHANTQPNNLGGLIAVTAGATSIAVGFQQGANTGWADISLTATGTGNTLVAGTYAYARTLLNPRGETGVGNVGDNHYKQVTVTAGQRVDIGLSGGANNYQEQRVYRKLLSEDRWQGFWQRAYGVASIADTGQAFDGFDGPLGTGYLASYQNESDANYAIVATPNWGTTCFVTAKATTGFTLNFGTLAPAGATVQWLLFRP